MDKVGNPTGPGKISEEVLPAHTLKHVKGPLITAHTLYNYNIDGNLLKPEHQKYIDEKILSILKGYRVHVKLIGTTSQSGDAAYNKQLSLERVLRVKKYLVSKGISEAQVPGEEMLAAGEYLSTASTQESERDRAVIIAIGWGTKPQPIYPVQVLQELIIRPIPELTIPQKIPTYFPKPSGSPTSTQWKMKYLGEGTVGSASMHTFWLVDLTNKKDVLCFLPTGNVGAGTSASLTLEGPWQQFTSPEPYKITDFSGPASFLSGPSAGPLSVADSRLMIANLSPNVIYVKSGWQIGAGAGGLSSGYIQCTEPKPYKPTP